MSSAYRKAQTSWQHVAASTGGMSNREPPRTAARRARSTTFPALVVVSAALLGVLAYQSLASSSFSAAAPIDMVPSDPGPAVAGVESDKSFPGAPRRHDEQYGAVRDGVTVFDDDIPAVAKLDPALRGALRRAATDAADDEVEIFVESGWRSAAYQEQLLREAISEYGSEKEAARWVATADRSAHVSGDAVDIGPFDATAWLSEHGADYGLCQIYRNEPWHYELRAEAVDRGCPHMYANPTHDPRMQR
jgi:zinc D-Ala-D-Ala carboxypeptidase